MTPLIAPTLLWDAKSHLFHLFTGSPLWKPTRESKWPAATWTWHQPRWSPGGWSGWGSTGPEAPCGLALPRPGPPPGTPAPPAVINFASARTLGTAPTHQHSNTIMTHSRYTSEIIHSFMIQKHYIQWGGISGSMLNLKHVTGRTCKIQDDQKQEWRRVTTHYSEEQNNIRLSEEKQCRVQPSRSGISFFLPSMRQICSSHNSNFCCFISKVTIILLINWAAYLTSLCISTSKDTPLLH